MFPAYRSDGPYPGWALLAHSPLRFEKLDQLRGRELSIELLRTICSLII